MSLNLNIETLFNEEKRTRSNSPKDNGGGFLGTGSVLGLPFVSIHLFIFSLIFNRLSTDFTDFNKRLSTECFKLGRIRLVVSRMRRRSSSVVH